MASNDNELPETDSLMTFDDYIIKELPEHLQRLIMENLKGSTGLNDVGQISNHSELNFSANGSLKGLGDALQASFTVAECVTYIIIRILTDIFQVLWMVICSGLFRRSTEYSVVVYLFFKIFHIQR